MPFGGYFRSSIGASPPDIGRNREPGPQLYERVRLGDVGYTRYGRFNLLFSAGEELGSRALGVDVPATFEPLRFEHIIRGSRIPGCLHTKTVREIGGGVRGSTTVGWCVCRL